MKVKHRHLNPVIAEFMSALVIYGFFIYGFILVAYVLMFGA